MRIINEKTVTNYAFPKVPDKEGYLLKKRTETKRSFKRRYFVLHGNVLTYSESKHAKEPLGVIFLEGHSVELVDENMFAIRFHTNTYSGRNYILLAESEAEAESWMQALTHCGSEFLTLSVEELEDLLRSLNSLSSIYGDSPSSKANATSADTRLNQVCTSRNPFNSSTIPLVGPTASSKNPMSHLTNLVALSWENMQDNLRTYLNNASEKRAPQHQQ
ncbi:unnamed protein product [Mesocestoides corti]|uniref:PH domain-containing protein n=1 Tax=Mesocestoides corti TaxID=53468 RepID=A0A0R3UAT1_MESCO|nr:unnamed protein product [Mesocestoides corti]